MKTVHRSELLKLSDTEIILTYNAELRGLANYYALAGNVKGRLNKLEYLSNYSLYETLAHKHKTKMTAVIIRLRQGNELVHHHEVKGETQRISVFRLKHMGEKVEHWDTNTIPDTLYLSALSSELVERLNYSKCEYCGREDLPMESRHVRKLKDLKDKPNLKMWQKVMISRNRKVLVLCVDCHDQLHAGTLPDTRYTKS